MLVLVSRTHTKTTKMSTTDAINETETEPRKTKGLLIVERQIEQMMDHLQKHCVSQEETSFWTTLERLLKEEEELEEQRKNFQHLGLEDID